MVEIDMTDPGPALMKLAAQLRRPAVEFGMLLADPVFWGWNVPRGDGRPVMVLPGFGGGDLYLQPLRGWLRRIGYAPVRSGLDQNPGWSEELVDQLGELATDQFRRTGSRVTVIGHSMGGLLGRSIALRRPHVVRDVIALASPLRATRSRLPASVAMTALYSRSDEVVRYPLGFAPDPHARNLEVNGSHIGMATNPEVYRRLGAVLGGQPRQRRSA
jgi:pimeloyl-ACP methyl ester carboxylesterase